jgi:hypothetical protein
MVCTLFSVDDGGDLDLGLMKKKKKKKKEISFDLPVGGTC